jgi:hypothetical protein
MSLPGFFLEERVPTLAQNDVQQSIRHVARFRPRHGSAGRQRGQRECLIFLSGSVAKDGGEGLFMTLAVVL